MKTRRTQKVGLGRTRRKLDSGLRDLERAELVRVLNEVEPAYFFKHALVQDTAQSTLLRGEHKRLNLLVAHAYERIYETRCMDEYAAVLAQHYAAGGDDAKTLVYAKRAGDLAARAYANPEAIVFYTQALDAAKSSSAPTAQLIYLYTKRGRILEVTGHDVEALATYQEMTEFARERGDRSMELESLLLRGKLHAAPSPVHDRTKAIALANDANLLALELGNRAAQAHALWNQQLLYLYSGEIPEAIRCGEEALTIARESDSRELLGYILTDLERAYLQSGQIHKIAEIAAEARAIWRELDNKPMLADNLMQSATQTMLRGEYDKAIALAAEGIEISQAIGSKLSLMSNQGTQMPIYLERGDVARALQLAEAILRESKEMTGAFNHPMQSSIAAWVYAMLGASERAAELAQEARAGLELPTAEFFRAWTWVMLARYYLAIGNGMEARAALATSQLENHLARVDPAVNFGMIALGECLLAEGAYARVIELMEQRVRTLRHLGLRATLHNLLYLQARAARALGDKAQAFELVQQARQVAEGMQARLLLWEIYVLAGELESDRGNVPQANAHREHARDVLRFIVEHTPEEFRESFLNLPQVRAVWN